MGLFRKLIRKGYKALSLANTAEILLTGNPGKITKHIIRRKLVRRAGRMVK